MNLTQLKWIKNVTDGRGIWAYQLNENQKEFGLNWSTGSEDNANKPQPGELILLKQRGKITHLVRVTDDQVQQDPNPENTEYKPYRSVEAVWVTPDWDNPPTIEQVFKHRVNLQSGYVVPLENIEAFRQYWNESRGSLTGFQDHIYKSFFDDEYDLPIEKNTELTVEYIFDLFVYHLGHKVIQRRHNRWRNSPEGWEHHALIHMWYWILRDFRGLTHQQAGQKLTGTDKELLERIMSELFTTLGERKDELQNQQQAQPVEEESTTPKANDFEEALRSLLEEQYGETIKLLQYDITAQGSSGLFLEPRRNWIFEFILQTEQQQLTYRPIEIIRSLTDEKLEKILSNLNQAELNALIQLHNLARKASGTVTVLDINDFADPDNSLETYGFYPSSEDVLPMLFYKNEVFGVSIGIYLCWESKDESLSESTVIDDPVDNVSVFDDFQEAVKHAIARLNYYIQES